MGEEAEALDDALDIREAKQEARDTATEQWRARNLATKCKHGLTEWDGPCLACDHDTKNQPPRKAPMAAAKKSTPKAPAPSARTVLQLPSAPAARERADDVVTALAEMAEAIKKRATQEDTRPYSQDDLIRVQALKLVKSKAESALKVFDATIKAWDGKVNECYERGDLVLLLEKSPRREVSWKDEAIALAKKVAELESRPFNEVVYVETTQNKVKPSTVYSVKVQSIA